MTDPRSKAMTAPLSAPRSETGPNVLFVTRISDPPRLLAITPSSVVRNPIVDEPKTYSSKRRPPFRRSSSLADGMGRTVTSATVDASMKIRHCNGGGDVAAAATRRLSPSPGRAPRPPTPVISRLPEMVLLVMVRSQTTESLPPPLCAEEERSAAAEEATTSPHSAVRFTTRSPLTTQRLNERDVTLRPLRSDASAADAEEAAATMASVES